MTDRLALGAMMFGTLQDERTSFELLDRYVDGGGVWIDTANCYAFWASETGHGTQSEIVLGKWLARRPGVRDKVKISTKVGCEPLEPNNFPETAEGLGAAVIKNGLEGSISRLGIDHIDLYWAHKPDPVTPLAETVAAFDEAVSSGAVGRLGCSNYPIWQVERARALAASSGGTGFTAIQQQYSYLQPRPGTAPSVVHRHGAVTDEVLHYVEHHPEMALWAYTPLLSGSYTRTDKPLAPEYDHPGTTNKLAALDEIAEETNTNRNQVVLAWLAGGQHAVTPIVGVSKTAQLDEALASVTLELTPEQRARLDAAA